MSLEERIEKSVEVALAEMRSRVEDPIRAIVTQLVTSAERERDDAVRAAEQRARADLDTIVESAREEERTRAYAEASRVADAKAQEQLEAALASSREELHRALATAEDRALQTVRESVTAAHVEEREAEMAAVSRLLESVRGLDGATTLSEVLDALGLAAAREACRAAVLVLRSDRLHGWKLSGFGVRDAQPKALDVSLAESGVLGLAVSSARPANTRDASAADAPVFADLPADRMGLAVPVIVGGRVVAVVYADAVSDDQRELLVPSSWPEVIEILARHAARCLEALTVQKSTTTTPSPRFWVPPAKAGPTSTESLSPDRSESAPDSRPAERSAGPVG
jgi:hypothetical protein